MQNNAINNAINNASINKSKRTKKPAKKGPGRNLADIRDHFTTINGKSCCTFNGCTKKYAANATAAQLTKHIFDDHLEAYQSKTKNVNKDISKIPNQDPEIQKIYDLFAIMFAKHSLPYSLTESQYFRNTVAACTNKTYPNLKITKQKLKECILSEAERIRNDMFEMLSCDRHPITIAFDIWTNTRSNKVTNVLLISNGIAYYSTSIENHSNSNNVAWLIPKLKDHITLLIQKKLNIIAVTTDNENLMRATCRKLNELFPVLITVPCAAHIMQLGFKKVVSYPTIKIIIDEAISIINIVGNSLTNSNNLKQLQEADEISNPLKLIHPTETRWTSLMDCIERLLKLQKYVKQISTTITASFWDSLSQLNIFLEPFKITIQEVQKDSATLYSIWENFNKIIGFYKSDKVPVIFNGVTANIVELFVMKWENHINNDLINAVRLFNLERNFKFTMSTTEFIINWGVIYLQYYDFIKDIDVENVKTILSTQLREFLSRRGNISNINSHDNELKKNCKRLNRPYNVALTWNSYIESYYELVTVSTSILSICPSEACVERSFSVQADVHSLDRNRLTDEMIDAEMCIRWNLK